MQLQSNNIFLKTNIGRIAGEAKLFLLTANRLVLDRAILCNHALCSNHVASSSELNRFSNTLRCSAAAMDHQLLTTQ